MSGLARRLIDDERFTVSEKLARATDATVLLPALRKAWQRLSAAGIAIAACSVERVYQRDDGGFVISLDARFEERGSFYPRPLIAEVPFGNAQAHFAQLVSRFMKRRRRRQLKSPVDPVEFCLVPELGLVVRYAGIDEKVGGLELLHAPDKLGAALFPPDCGGIRARLVAHRLHRRAVVEAQATDSAPVYLKLYKRDSGRPERNVSLVRFLDRTAFGESSSVRVPKILALLPAHSGFAMAEARGRPVNELQGAARMNGIALAGEALGRLHRLPICLDASFAAGDEIKLLSRLMNFAAGIFPALRKDLKAGLSSVSAALASCGGHEPGIVHRDFHERQIIVDGSTCHLIDFDTVCNGDPHQDIGNFLAHLDLAELQGTPGAEDSAAAFLDAYGRAHRAPIPGNVTAHRQSTLLRLACIYAFSTRWTHLSPKLVDIACGSRS